MSDVTIYTTPTCVYCQMAKRYFDANDVDYTEKDAQNDVRAQQEMIERSGQMGVPVILVGDELVVGFDKPKLDRLLRIAV